MIVIYGFGVRRWLGRLSIMRYFPYAKLERVINCRHLHESVLLITRTKISISLAFTSRHAVRSLCKYICTCIIQNNGFPFVYGKKQTCKRQNARVPSGITFTCTNNPFGQPKRIFHRVCHKRF